VKMTPADLASAAKKKEMEEDMKDMEDYLNAKTPAKCVTDRRRIEMQQVEEEMNQLLNI